MFIQIFLGLYEEKSRKFKYFSAGHVSGFVKRAAGGIVQLLSSAISIGLNESEKYATNQIELSSGDLIVLIPIG